MVDTAAPPAEVVQVNIKLLSGKFVALAIPNTLTDDEVCQLIMEIAKNLPVRARRDAELRQRLALPNT
jgi:hypothetical protein